MIYRMAIRILDELKTLKSDIDETAVRRIIMDYFDEMGIPEEEISRRTNAAVDLERVIRNLFLLALAAEVTREELINRLISEYSQIVLEYGYRPNYAHIERVAEDVIDHTLEKIDVEFITSEDRSIMIAENEINNVGNNDEYLEAKENGKTTKTWHTMNDNKVRDTHVVMDGVTIGIDEFFHVGEAEMLYPLDEENAYDHPEETNNCRCSVTYD